MTVLLAVAGHAVQLLTPTTTAILATRMLAASAVLAAQPLRDIYRSPALDILLALHVAEEASRYLSVSEIAPDRSSPALVNRWINVLVEADLVERRDDVLALSDEGHKAVIKLLSGIFEAQRAID